jgi:RNA methyltransferase, TrmH family
MSKMVYLHKWIGTVLTKNELKYYSSLLNKKSRRSESKFLVEGIKLIMEATESGFECDLIISSKSFCDGNARFFKGISKMSRVEIVHEKDLGRISDAQNPQGAVGIFKIKQAGEETRDEDYIIALENLADPGNLGTIIRNADWFGFRQIILSPGCTEVFNPKVIRASAGSVFHLSIREDSDFYRNLEKYKKSGHRLYCADLGGVSVYNLERKGKAVIAFANEASGPTERLKNLADISITIPGKGKAESLNVASASAVILSEFAK